MYCILYAVLEEVLHKWAIEPERALYPAPNGAVKNMYRLKFSYTIIIILWRVKLF